MYATYAQNGEDILIQNYFEGYIGNILSLGENDGLNLSNCFALIERGWNACLVEPATEAFEKLEALHNENKNVHCFQLAVGNQNDHLDFWESGTHLNQGDTGLLSTLCDQEKKKWEASTEFRPTRVQVYDFNTLLGILPTRRFDFISIDCEGMDLDILKQMDLRSLGCRCICIEWNSKNFTEYDSIITGQNLFLLEKNEENLIYVK